MDVGEDTAVGDGDLSKKGVELLVVLDGKGDVPGDNAGLLVVTGGVSGKLKNLSAEVLKDGSEVDTSAGTDAVGVSSLLQVTSDTSDGELKSSLGRRAGALSGSASSLSFSFSCSSKSDANISS